MRGLISEYRKYLDSDLVSLAKKGDETARSVLFERYEASVRSFVSKYLQNDNTYVEDVCMLTFEKFFRNISSFDISKELKPWLLTISKNTALDQLDSSRKEDDKREKVKEGTTLETSVLGMKASDMDLEREIIMQQDYERLMALMDGLDEKYRTVIKKRIVEDLDYDCIAKELELPLNTVKTRIHRARQMLMEQMRREEE
ncbi:MAG: RNA polymerase sigma factor [Bacteroidales bacterium]|nr:RNA polymerase sigma factor [Bacteroidales bacterium]